MPCRFPAIDEAAHLGHALRAAPLAGETREERRQLRTAFGLPMLAAFVLYAAYAALDMARVLMLISDAKRTNVGNRWALIGIAAVAHSAIIERLGSFAMIGGALGLAALATRGWRVMVRLDGGGSNAVGRER